MEDEVKLSPLQSLDKMQSLSNELKKIKNIGDEQWFIRNTSSLWAEFASNKGLTKIWYDLLGDRKTDSITDPEERVLFVDKCETALKTETIAVS